ncbi:MAG: ATP-dependent Clp protease proteolytic subunit [Elusimicrobia bacterium CG1_02_37_114]|nr:MAG: ATP-dependent Clp protease proteolytic subunit [Elusimicrobia bacterium CG1_02_37_114]PIZ14168.1 MAG: ATP-dependent Clp protease proteolytic subunit [Elusimicrobia bacterium CG_4_10_14_0_8_um_filter_37_32]
MPNIIPGVVERWNQGAAITYDIFSRLLRERIIFVGGYEGVVTTDSANILVAQLLYLEAEDSEKDVFLYINSPGGELSSALAIYDSMQYVKPKITTVCIGKAMSAGALLLAAGTKGKRFALPHARLMIHQPLIMGGGISGAVTDIDIETRELVSNKNKLIEILAKHTGQKIEKIKQDMERNFYMSAEEAKEYGLIDEVIVTRKT